MPRITHDTHSAAHESAVTSGTAAPTRARSIRSGLSVALVVIGLTACGGSDSSDADVSTTEAPTTESPTTEAPAPDSTAPETTEAEDAAAPSSDAPAAPTTEAPAPDSATSDSTTSDTTTSDTTTSDSTTSDTTTSAAIDASAADAIEATPELADFAEANAPLIEEWSVNLTTFGEEVFGFIDDISKAPSATPVRELSQQIADAIGTETTDPGLITVRGFAETMAMAIASSADGDQDAALEVLLGLQASQAELSAVLEQIAG